MIRYGILIVAVFLAISCSYSTENSQKQFIEQTSPVDSANVDAEDETGPPFKTLCLADLKEFGRITTRDQLNIYLSGYLLDLSKASCRFGLGEYIYNEAPPKGIKIMKIHLIDLEKYKIPQDSSLYGSDKIKQYVVAIFNYDSTHGMKASWDPYKTGKYKMPKNWED